MGCILLKLIRDNTKLCKKRNLRAIIRIILDMSNEHHSSILQEKNDLHSKLAKNPTDTERNLNQKELNSHTINQSVEPSLFSHHVQL